jgi:hypothetical protein
MQPDDTRRGARPIIGGDYDRAAGQALPFGVTPGLPRGLTDGPIGSIFPGARFDAFNPLGPLGPGQPGGDHPFGGPLAGPPGNHPFGVGGQHPFGGPSGPSGPSGTSGPSGGLFACPDDPGLPRARVWTDRPARPPGHGQPALPERDDLADPRARRNGAGGA